MKPAICRNCGKGIPEGGDTPWVGAGYKRGFYHTDCIPPNVEVDETELFMNNAKTDQEYLFEALSGDTAQEVGARILKALYGLWPQGFILLHLSVKDGKAVYGFELISRQGHGQGHGSHHAEFDSIRKAWINAVQVTRETCTWKVLPPTADTVTREITNLSYWCHQLELLATLGIWRQATLQIQTTFLSDHDNFGIGAVPKKGDVLFLGWGPNFKVAVERIQANLAARVKLKTQKEREEKDQEQVRAFMQSIQPGDLWLWGGSPYIITRVDDQCIYYVGASQGERSAWIYLGTSPEVLAQHKAQHVRFSPMTRKLFRKLAKFFMEQNKRKSVFAPKNRYELRLTFGKYVFEIRRLPDRSLSKMIGCGAKYGTWDYPTLERWFHYLYNPEKKA